MHFKSSKSTKLQGQIKIPGDKSISHRAIMFGSIAEGITTVSGFLEGADCLATMEAFKAMGVHIEQIGPEQLKIHGVGLHGLLKPKNKIDLGNSGTSIRLLSGILAGQSFESILTGDESLSNRPMNRVVLPLREMGANITTADAGKPPLTIKPCATLVGIHYHSPMASAQVKSCVLLAGLYAEGETCVTEPAPSRDHTERMLKGFGIELKEAENTVSLRGGQTLKATNIEVPGDISSAAFFMVAASIVSGSEILLKNVGMNPTRIGCINILKLMGANISVTNERTICGEPVADLLIKSAELKGINIPVDSVPLAIDEFPVLFIAAACAKGQTILHGAKELRVKESDRIHSMALGLKALGIECTETEDGIIIEGGELKGGEVECFHDHRIAMAFSIAGLVADSPVLIKDCDNVKTSFPNFTNLLQAIGGNIEVQA